MTKINVLQFITPAGFYGAERWVLALANNIDTAVVNCDLAVTRETADQDLTVAELYPTDSGQQVHYLDMNGRFDLRVIKQLCQVIRERDIHIIHTHGYKSDILGLIAARRTGIRCVSTPHGFSGNVGFKLRAFIKAGTFMLRYFDQVVPLSEELARDMARMGVPAAKTRFIRNGVDLTEIAPLVEASSTPEADGQPALRTIGFIGQMIPRKGIPDLLAVFDRLCRRHLQLRLQLLGDGAQRPELEAIARQLPSSDAIGFLGFRSDRLELLSRFDLFVMTSSLEGIPRCMMEAMAMNIPVAAYDIPGVDQLVEHEVTGLLAPHGDRDALEACCHRLLTDSNLAQTLTTNARALIDKQYSAARMAREYEALFRALTAPGCDAPSKARRAG
ncbi:MAG TPA: glycosyltransferase family 4 protein [Marinobacter sp.]|nr:glycosyltransferase family 4 protein [Marinobacter sp.]